MRAKYGERLVVYDALRSERNAFADKRVADNYKKGEDALVDSLLLSCANYLIKPASALSEFSACKSCTPLAMRPPFSHAFASPDPSRLCTVVHARRLTAMRAWSTS